MASKRRLRRRGCESKRRYETGAEAQRHVFDGMRVYRCPFSKGGPAHFHVGHLSLRAQAGKARALGMVQ